MTLAKVAFELKDIDWALFGIVFGIFAGVLALSALALFIEHMLNSKKVEGTETSVVTTFIKSYLTEIVYFVTLIVLIILFFAGNYKMAWSDEDWNMVYDKVTISKFFFGGAASVLGQTLVLTPSPLLFAGFSLVAIAVILTICGIYPSKRKEFGKICNILALVFTTIAFVLVVVVFTNLTKFFDFSAVNNKNLSLSDGGSYETFFSLFFLILLALCNVRKVFNSVKYTTQDICEEGVLIALAVVLDNFVKIKMFAEGGSIGLAAVPLFIIAIRHGAYKGFVASAVMFGLITCMIDGYGFQTYPFDYFIGFGGYGMVGLFFGLAKIFYKNAKEEDYKKYEFIYSTLGIFVGCFVAMIIRYAGSCTSSMVLYSYSFKEAFFYNSTYIPATMLIDFVVTIALLKPILIINERFKYNQIG